MKPVIPTPADGAEWMKDSMDQRNPEHGPTRSLAFDRLTPAGTKAAIARTVADETPIAVEFNGLGYAVLMATADDLADLAYGFALAERLIDSVDDVVDIDTHPMPEGMVLRVTLAQHCTDRVVARVRHRVSESSCGLCGIENLEQALRPIPRVDAQTLADDKAIFAALEALRDLQPLNAATGAVHGAALVRPDGTIAMVREDVGRHNAFDKLIGAMLRSAANWDGGFALLTSRCSYELVEKAALANCPMLVTISAPTALAVKRANEAGLRLVVLARSDSVLASPAMDDAR